MNPWQSQMAIEVSRMSDSLEYQFCTKNFSIEQFLRFDNRSDDEWVFCGAVARGCGGEDFTVLAFGRQRILNFDPFSTIFLGENEGDGLRGTNHCWL